MSPGSVASAGAVRPATSPADRGRDLSHASRTVLAATLLGRLSGFARVAMVGAVLGPTYFANLFQTALLVPYVIGQLLLGALIPLLLTPHLVRCRARGDEAGVARLAGGFLAVMLLLFAAAAVLAAPALPWLLRLLVAAVGDPTVRDEQVRLGVPLALCLLPQMLLAAICGVGIAVQQAHGRFALSTAAPALENVVTILVLVVVALAFGVGIDVDRADIPLVLLLGLGSTAGVALHAAVQWWGAARVGVRLRPMFGRWRDPDVRTILRGGVAAAGQSSLDTLAWFSAVVASGSVAGGSLGFQIAYNLYNLPVALGARPLATAQLPLLARHLAEGRERAFRTVASRTLGLAAFLVIPVGVIFAALPLPLAGGVTFGEMRSATGMGLVAACIAGLGVGLVAESAVIVLASAAYARHDTGAPLVANVIRFATAAAGIAASLSIDAPQLRLLALAGSVSAGSVAAAMYLLWRQRHPLARALYRVTLDVATAALAATPALLLIRPLPEPAAVLPGIALAAATGAATLALYLLLQGWRGAPELAALLAMLRGRRHPPPRPVLPLPEAGP